MKSNLQAAQTLALSVISTVVLTISSSVGMAIEKAEGTAAGGGGALLEAAFKTTGLQLAQEVMRIPEPIAQKYLLFTKSELFAAASSAGTECATGSDLQMLIDQKKLAYVKPNSNIILLQCYRENAQELVLKSDWQGLLNSLINRTELSVSSKVLVAHELLRTIGREDENRYVASGSLAAAIFEINRFKARKIQEMVGTPSPTTKCWLQLIQTNSNNYCGGTIGPHLLIKFAKRGDSIIVEYCYPGIYDSGSVFLTRLLKMSHEEKYVNSTIQRLEDYGCFED